MIRSKFFKLLICLVFGVSVIMLLALIAKWGEGKNHFIRRFPDHKMVGLGSIPIEGNFKYFAGCDSGSFYLGDWRSPAKLTQVDFSNKKLKERAVVGFGNRKFHKGVYLRVTKNDFGIFDGKYRVHRFLVLCKIHN